jgi:hypothetical protein
LIGAGGAEGDDTEAGESEAGQEMEEELSS